MDNQQENEYIKRINELARKAKTVGLTDEEIEERNDLRKKYIEGFKTSLRAQLDNITIVDNEDDESGTQRIKH